MKKGLRIGIRKFGRLATLNVYLETQECMEIFRYVLQEIWLNIDYEGMQDDVVRSFSLFERNFIWKKRENAKN